MTATILNGRALAARVLNDMANCVQERQAKGLRVPGLGVILVGADPASRVYVGSKRKACAEIGFHSVALDLPETTSQDELVAWIDRLNADDTIDGILVQLPLPDHIASSTIIERIRPDKDVDGFHPYN